MTENQFGRTFELWYLVRPKKAHHFFNIYGYISILSYRIIKNLHVIMLALWNIYPQSWKIWTSLNFTGKRAIFPSTIFPERVVIMKKKICKPCYIIDLIKIYQNQQNLKNKYHSLPDSYRQWLLRLNFLW